MNKKLSIFAIILIIVGLVGTIWSGINTMPYFMSEISKAEQEAIKEDIIYNEDMMNLKKLTIYTTNSNITVKRNNENKIRVNKIGNMNDSGYDVTNEENSLTIKEIENNRDYNFKMVDFKELFDMAIDSLVSIRNEGLIVYLPNDFDLEVVTVNGNLNVESNVITQNISFKTSTGRIYLPKEVKSLERLQIVSSNEIYLDMVELLGIKNIDIQCRDLTIYSDESYMFINDVENYIPQNLNITKHSNNSYDSDIYISSSIPVAQNLNINGNNSIVHLQIPIEKYKINFDANASENIVINNSMFENYTENEDIKQIKGVLNKEAETLENQYNVNIKSSLIEIQ